MALVSVFKNFNSITENLELSDILQQIKEGVFRKEIEALRNLVNQNKIVEYTKKKKSLLGFTPSGLFEGGRKPQHLKEYTQCIILDIDKLSTEQIQQAKSKINANPYTYSCFCSPSNLGLKIICRVDIALMLHKQAFNLLKEFYENLLKLPIDPSGKDITRLCFYSYDPDLYFNPESLPFPASISKEPPLRTDVPPARLPQVVSIEDYIETIVSQIESNHLDITSSYADWLKICFALIDAQGVSARDNFHRVSKFYPSYDYTNCNTQFDKCLKSTNSGITIKTFFKFAKDYGIGIGNEKSLSVNLSSKRKQTQSEIILVDNPKTPKQKKITTNKFQLAKNYLERNFDIRNNVISNEFEFRTKGAKEFQSLNENTVFVNMQLDGMNINLNHLIALLKSDIIVKYNPFIDYFKNLPAWDLKTDHILHLSKFVKVSDNDRYRFENHFKKWLVRVVACALIDSYFNKQAFILVHEKQNSGKSTFCRFLCPPQLQSYIAENISIDKDSRILLTRNLLINLDELSTLSKVEINSLKSLFSKDKINERLPYDRRNSIIPRRCSFIGSTNQTEFLNDESGSVRWLCFIIEEIVWSYKQKVNMDMVYAQAFHLFRNSFKYELTVEEIKENEEHNRQFLVITSERELIAKHLLPGTKDKHTDFFSATDILTYLAVKTSNTIKLSPVGIGKAMKINGFERIKHPTEQIYGYYIRYKL